MQNTPQLDDFTRAYLECALWSSNDESTPAGGEPMDANYSVADISDGTLATMLFDCAQFQARHAALLARLDYPRVDHSQMARAGHDFWLTRNGHGAGFWDGDLSDDLGDALTAACKAFPEFNLYIGDDGKIYH